MIRYDLDKLIKLSVCKPESSDRYRFKRKSKSFWSGCLKEGIYDYFNRYRGDSVAFHFIEDGIVYRFAECKLYFQDEHTYTYHFRTVEEAMAKSKEMQEEFKKRTGRELFKP